MGAPVHFDWPPWAAGACVTSGFNREILEGEVVDLVEIEAQEAAEVAFIGERRSNDTVARLSRKLNDACTAAITPHQIAALLEAEGLNDRLVEERYGRPGVFPLAEELYERVPLRRSPSDADPPPEAPSPVPQPSTFALIMRGPLYLAPLLFFLAAGSFLAGPQLVMVGLLALLLAWVWNQGFGALTHRLIGRLDIAGAHLVARLTLFSGVAVVTVMATVVTSIAFDPSVEIALFAAGQSGYLIGAAMLLVFGRDKILAIVLAPGGAIALASLLTDGIPQSVVLGATILTPVAVVGAAFVVTRNPRRVSYPHIGPQDRSIALIHALLGLTWALVIGLGAVSVIGTASVLTTVSVAASGMVLTMGVAEWQLLVIRRSLRKLLVETGNPRRFAHGARVIFARAMTMFTLSLILASTLVAAIAAWAGLLTDVSAVLAVGFGFLGIVFFAGLALVSMNHLFVPFAGGVALIIEVSALLYQTSLDPTSSAGIYTMGCGILCLLTATAAMVTVARPALHR